MFRPFALAATLAAFPSNTLDYMTAQVSVAPTLQMILRRNLKSANTLEEYLSGGAHRPVLQGEDLRPERMISHAASMTPEDVPPVAQLSVIEEDFGKDCWVAMRV